MNGDDKWQPLSFASSQTEHTHVGSNREGCRGCRWFEVALSRLEMPNGWRYGVVIAGKSVIPGETDRIRHENSTSPHAIVDFLAMGSPTGRYIPKISRKALHEAADIDGALADALDDFDEIAGAKR